MNKGDEVADDEDDDDVRTSVSEDRMTATLCTEELFIRTLLRPNVDGGEDTYAQSK
jgi:hypothetical protein